MSANTTSLRDFVEAAKQRVPRDLHPTTYEYLSWAELRWDAESFESTHTYCDAAYAHRRADRVAGISSDWMMRGAKWSISNQSCVRPSARWSMRNMKRNVPH